MNKSQATHLIHAIDDDLTACGLSPYTNRVVWGVKPTCGRCARGFEYVRSKAFQDLVKKAHA